MRMFAWIVTTLIFLSNDACAIGQSVEFRLRERNNTTSPLGLGPPTFGGTGTSGAAATASQMPPPNSSTLWFIVEARVSGFPADADTWFGGLASFSGSIEAISAPGQFRFNGNGRNASPANIRFPGTPSLFPSSGRGIYSPWTRYRDEGEIATGTVQFANGVATGINQIAGGISASTTNLFSDNAGGPSDAASFALNAWQPIYTFQFDVLYPGWMIVFRTHLDAHGFTRLDGNNLPIEFPLVATQSIYSLNVLAGPNAGQIFPTPGAAALLGLGGLLAARRRR